MQVHGTIAVVVIVSVTGITRAADVPRGGVAHKLDKPRIAPLEQSQWTAEQRALLEPMARGGSVPNIYRTMANHPKMFTPRLNFGRYIQRESSLPPREREMLICRIAWLSGGEYEWSAHTAIARQNGLSADDVRRLAAGPEATGWNDADRAVLRAVDELFDNTFVSDATWQTLSQRFNQDQMMDLVMTVGAYHMLAMALDSFGTPLEANATRFDASREAGAAPRAAPPTGASGQPTRLKTPRIATVSESQWTAKDHELLDPIKASRGTVPNVYNTLARHAKMYPLWLDYARYILRESTLPAREREMLILRIAWLASGEYEWSAHARLGQEAGLSADEVSRIAKDVAGSGWNDNDRALLTAVDELHRDVFISDATWEKLSSRLSTQQMMDLVLTVGAYKMLAMALNSFGTQLEPGAAGFPK